MRKRGFIVTPQKFREGIDQNAWFAQALKDRAIDFWNFNSFLWPDYIPCIAWRADEPPPFYVRVFILDRYKGIYLGTPLE